MAGLVCVLAGAAVLLAGAVPRAGPPARAGAATIARDTVADGAAASAPSTGTRDEAGVARVSGRERQERRAPASGFDPGRAGFRLKFAGETTPFRVTAATALPGEALELKIDDGRQDGGYTLEAATGEVVERGPRRWVWRVPAAGLHPLRIRRDRDGAAMTLNVFVLVPLDRVRNGALNGYRIGEYPATALKGLSSYRPPRGLIEVTPGNVDTPVSPHFTLGQFLCKQEADWPRYLVLRTRLLLKLEILLEKVNEAGIRCDGFHVMSGYRTPWYNQQIGNVKYSRHVYGGAADIFVDEAPRDGHMDDLNRDGRIDVRDAGVLYAVIDGQYGDPFYEPFVGGLGQYKRTANHGPFVHVDVRGFRARWGD